MGLLARGQTYLNRSHGSTEKTPAPVTYSRRVGATTHMVVINRARYGRTLFSGLREQGVAVQWGERDYLIEVAELVLNGQPTTPQRGDRITDGAIVWELSSPETDEAPWRYSDNYRTVFRVHCKRAS